MRAKGIKPRDKSGKFIAKVGPRGGDRVASAAFMIARSIKRNGIHGLKYYSVALESIVPQFSDKPGRRPCQRPPLLLSFKTGNITVKLK